ncbi:hypothetical protein [Paraliomyxa miuraensis]|uniref:hypothetical protein n=1 Tax=Paraliomyxa miuraensis TaxID=376150 RepID=UPI002252F63F|nr:hypothetical protein [Paraliomyxa miuraensis]MCX4243664.1 hypothetical protein [Paraliomyxa miuraensis]
MRSIGFLVFQSLRKGSYLHDAEISMLSGQLGLEGVPNEVVEAVFDGSNLAENAVVLAKLVDVLAEWRFDILVFHRIWDPQLPRTLRARLHDRGLQPVFVLHRTKEIGATDPYDCVLGASPVGALRAMARAPAPLHLSEIAGLSHRDPDGNLVDDPPGKPEPVIPRWERTSNFRRIHVNPEAAGRPPAVVIHGNPGCPYRKPVSAVPAWRRLALDPKTTNTRGCAFCDVNLGEKWRHVHEIAAHCLRQIRQVQSDLPQAYEMILLDQDPFPYLPDLMQELATAGARPVHLLIQARADLFLERTDAFEQALVLARTGGHRLSPFLVGIENFHQPTLDFYNKGVSVETNVQVLDYLEDVGQRFADVMDLEKMSPGFILWHPWVTMESLRANQAALASTKLMRFRSEVVLSKIRLYPDIPFYWKAKEDGLLLPSYGAQGLDSSVRYGYDEEHPYRFERPRAQAAYTLLAGLSKDFEPVEELPLLALVLDWVDAHPEYGDEELALGLREPAALRERFDADHRDDVASLRRREGSLAGKRDATEAQRRDVLARLGLPPSATRIGSGRYELARLFCRGDRRELVFAPRGRAHQIAADPRSAAFVLFIEPRSSRAHYMQTRAFNLSYSMPAEDPLAMSEVTLLCQRIAAVDDGEDPGSTERSAP